MKTADGGQSDAAVAVRTLAVLLQAGARPAVAWRHLADSGVPAAERILTRLEKNNDLPAAIEEEGGVWADVAAAWEVATTVGAPLAEVLRALAESLQDAASTVDDVRVALAEPAGTARLLLWLPVAGLVMGFALGFDTLGVITHNPFGIACAVAGLMLIAAARLWTGRLVRRAQPEPGTPGMRAELMAVAVGGGAAISRATALVDRATVAPDDGKVQSTLELSRSAGVPAAELLRATAAQQRHDARVTGRMIAATLSARLLVPLGLCTLPAFLLLGVAPLMISVIADTSLTG